MFTGPLHVYHNTMLRTDRPGFKTVWGIVAGSSAKWQHDIFRISSINNVFMTGGYYLRDEQAKASYRNYVFGDLRNMGNYSNPYVLYSMTGTCASGGDCIAVASSAPGPRPGGWHGGSLATHRPLQDRQCRRRWDADREFQRPRKPDQGCPRQRGGDGVRPNGTLGSRHDRLIAAPSGHERSRLAAPGPTRHHLVGIEECC